MHLKVVHYDSSLDWIGLSEWFKILLCHNDNSMVEELTLEFFDHSEGSNYITPFEKFLNFNKLSLETMGWHPIFPLAFRDDSDDTK